MLGVLLLIWLGFDVLTGGIFLTARNLFNLSLQVAVVGIMACGMVLVIVSRHIDLSVGSQIGFIGVFGALLQTGLLRSRRQRPGGSPASPCSRPACLIGAAAGRARRLCRHPVLRGHAGGLLFFRNAAYQINEGKTISPLDPTFQLLGGGINGTIGAFWSWIVGARRHRRDRAGGGAARPAPAARPPTSRAHR